MRAYLSSLFSFPPCRCVQRVLSCTHLYVPCDDWCCHFTRHSALGKSASRHQRSHDRAIHLRHLLAASLAENRETRNDKRLRQLPKIERDTAASSLPLIVNKFVNTSPTADVIESRVREGVVLLRRCLYGRVA